MKNVPHATPLHHHSHHTHGMTKRTLRLAFFLTSLILVAGLLGGILANSLALLSDAGHSVTDLFALGLAWFAAEQAERPSDERKTFGYHRVGILAALFNALSLIAIAIGILWEALQRFQHPEPVVPGIMFAAALLAVIINGGIAFGLHRDEHTLNTRAARLHVLGDIGASLGVMLASVLLVFFHWTFVDPLLSVGIAFVIALGALHILREAIDILLEATPRDISLSALVEDMKSVEGVQDVHDLHVWSIASGMSALSSHVLIDNLPPSASSPILQTLTAMLDEKYHINHTTIQFECSASLGFCCEEEALYCRLEVVRDPCCNEATHAR